VKYAIHTRAKSSREETLKYLITKNHTTLILINVKYCAYWCLVRVDFSFRRSTDRKKRVNIKQ